MSADAYDLSERLYQAADAVRDGAPVPSELAAFLGGLQGGGQLGPDGSPAASSTPAPEVLPYAAPEAAGSFGELLRDVPDVERLIAAGDAEAASLAAERLAARYNATADAHARQEAPHHYPPAPVDSDQGLQELVGQVRAAWADPAGVDQDGLDRLVEQVNGTVEGISRDAERRADAIEEQQQAAERQRAAQRRQEQPLVEQLERLLAQARAGQPAGR